MVGPGGLDSGLVHRDNSAVGVGDQAVLSVAVSGTVGSTVGNRVSSVQTSTASTGGKVVSTGSSHGRLINRDHRTVGVGDQVGVQVEGSGVSMEHRGGHSGVGGGNRGVHRGSDGDRGSGVGAVVLSGDGFLGGEVVSTGSSHGGLIHGDNGPVRVTDQVGVQVEGAGVAVASSIAKTSGGIGGATDAGVSNSMGDGSSSGVTYTSVPCTSVQTSMATAGSEVVSTGSSHSGLVHRDNSTVGVGDQAVLGSRDRQTGGENLKHLV